MDVSLDLKDWNSAVISNLDERIKLAKNILEGLAFTKIFFQAGFRD